MKIQLLKLGIVSFLLFQTICSFSQIFTEDFSSGIMPPADWTVLGGGEDNWHIYASSDNAGGTAPEAAFAWGPPYFSGNSMMVTPLIATSGYSSLLLEFNSYVWDFAGSGYSYKIKTTSDSGVTWNEVWSISPTADIPAELVTLVIENEDVGSDNFQFAITFDGESSNINYWYFDNFSLSNNTAESYSVTYFVQDEDGSPLEDASVNLQSNGTLLTDALGKVVFDNVLPGEYTWWSTADGLSTEDGMITVIDSDVSQDVVLSVSSELLSEYFAGGTFPPDGWSINGDGQSNWRQLFSNFAGEDYPELNFTSAPVFSGISKFVSPQIKTSSYEDLFLRFNHNLMDSVGTDYSIKVETTSDGGVTWNEIWSRTPTEDLGTNAETIIISNADVGSDIFQFAFTFEGNSFNIENWYIDDVVLTAAAQKDAAMLSVNIPGLTTPGVELEPSVVVGNMGAETISFQVTLEFSDGVNDYFETSAFVDLDPLTTETVVFPNWNSIGSSFDGKAYVNLLDDENLENDQILFAFEVADQLVDKKPLYEMFTSSTCPPCPLANETLDALLDNNPGEYALIKYQMNWPGTGDLYYTEECGTRGEYYNIFSVPDLYANAENFFPPANITQADFDAFQDVRTALEIEITEATIDDQNIVSIAADLVSLVNYSAGLSARIAIVEKLTTGNVGSNGELEFHHVMIKMLPDASGQILEELETGVTTTITETYDMNLTNMEDSNDLAVVVFVQDDTNKSVVQSAMIDVSMITRTEEILYSQLEFKLKPNPASTNLVIESASDFQKIEIYNQLGQLVKIKSSKGNIQILNLAEFQSGVYIVKVFFEGIAVTKSLVVK